MRKHFLLLMLMALLPLAGWAADLDGSKIAISNHEYGTATALSCAVQGDVYTENTDFTVDYTSFYTTSACTAVAKDAEETAYTLATLPVGTYYLKVTGKGVYLTSDVVVSFRVYGVNITIAFNDDQAKTYGSADPAFTYTLKKGDDDFANTGNVLGLTVGREPGEDVKDGGYAFTFSASNTNYLVTRKTSENNVFTINKKTFATAQGIALTVGDADLTYTGANQAPAITVKDGDATLTSGTDYTISYTYSADNVVAYAATDANANAGYYKVTVAGKGNYTGGTVTEATPFQIKKAALNVYVNDYNKTYDATATIPAEVTVGFSGLKGADESKSKPFGDNAFTIAYVTPLEGNGNKWCTETGYALKPVADSPSDAYNNYQPTLLNTGKLYVQKKAITVKPTAGQSKSFSDPDPNFTVDASEACAADVNTVKGAYNVTRSGSDEAVGTYPNVLSLTLKSNNNNTTKNVLNQYTITTETADFQITAATLYVYPKNVTITYGDTYDVANFTVIAANEKGTTVTLTQTPTVKIKGDNQHPTNQGTYVLELVGDAAATGYETVNKLDGQFIIEKRALTITPLAQVLHVGDKVTNLNQEKVTYSDLVEGDVIGYALSFNTGTGDGQIAAAKFTDDDDTKALLAAAEGVYAKGIKIAEDLAVEGNANDNYTITWTATGELTVGDAAAIAFLADDDDWAEIVKFDNKTATGVTLKNRADQPLATYAGDWKKEEWNTIILPFETSARKLSAAFGYAIVNVVNPSATTEGNVAFTLAMGTIPANTPIAIKTDEDILGGALIDFGNIDGKKIVKPAAKKVEIEAGAGHKFVGVYETTKIDKTTPNYHFLVNGGWKHIGTNSTRSFNIVPFNCYVDQSPAATARDLTFTFEEADGTTTTIKAVEANVVDKNDSVNNTGWYTINGVKLNAAPTQKGIYIKNGKKFFVK